MTLPHAQSGEHAARGVSLFQVEGVSFGYSGSANLALRDVSLAIERGEYLGLLGENGAGKSTLLRLLTGALTPTAGRVLLDGKPITAYGRAPLARRIAVLPQRLSVAFDVAVEELVLVGRTPHGGPLAALRGPSAADRSAVARAMEVTDTARFCGRTFQELSGGEQQRVALALALAQEPEILLLDEPTSHLDPGHALHMLELVAQLHQEGWTSRGETTKNLTVVAVFHDLNLAALYAGRLAVLRDGRVLADGSAQDVLCPDVLQAAFGAGLHVLPHPTLDVPQVLPIPLRGFR
ncbi:MAG TPA: ABC transporter ATP-binding protein [Chloroflexota bacterium]|nr:ABC transporter ATP-binding protein [Chloroflexota bacterium]